MYSMHRLEECKISISIWCQTNIYLKIAFEKIISLSNK